MGELDPVSIVQEAIEGETVNPETKYDLKKVVDPMHEMPVTQRIINMALEYAKGHRITDIYIRLGRMSSIIPESVEVFFHYLSKDSPAEGAKLHFEITPLELTCTECGSPVDINRWAEERPHTIILKAIEKGCRCGSKSLRVTKGVGFEMVSIDVEKNI